MFLKAFDERQNAASFFFVDLQRIESCFRLNTSKANSSSNPNLQSNNTYPIP